MLDHRQQRRQFRRALFQQRRRGIGWCREHYRFYRNFLTAAQADLPDRLVCDSSTCCCRRNGFHLRTEVKILAQFFRELFNQRGHSSFERAQRRQRVCDVQSAMLCIRNAARRLIT